MDNDKEPQEEQENQEPQPTAEGESGQNEAAGADNGGQDYSMIMNALTALQENQAAMSLQIKAISDAQSVLVDSGAVVREMPAAQMSADYGSSDEDDFVSIDDLDLSI